ncbi:hypothetical protein [Stygiolobus caldivivus]|uniref:Uncharacterized protein n=1 Tax=Stygiolobus caldivivus TaxID=2824673 RepID=A0A8D5U923_9CREN|nr:hypothetical protein [Stygiolobus caldivivus]BCU71182.1 hypothetical protein KN1_24790 [Stygiolobus caldivivus]
MGEPDFLRHIVSKVLTPVSLDLKKLDEAQKLLAKAESKYGFSSYGGDPEKLANYLLSPDFINLVLIIGVDLSKKLLYLTRDSYSSPKIKEAVQKMLDELDGYSGEETNQVMMYK